MTTWAAIVRVSHVGARGGESFHADDDQVSDIERYARPHNAQLVFMEPELSVSGGKTIAERPSLERAIEGVERGEFDGIVVAYLSRLTRSRSGIAIWDRVEAAGGHVHCAAENLDTSTPSGRFVRDIHLANAVREREEHADRHARRRRQTVEAGVWRQRQIPRGYAFKGPADDEGRFRGTARRLVPGPDAGQVQQAFQQRAAGGEISAIARRLEMTTSGVRALLRNRVYLGELRDGESVNLAAHEPLVSIDLFEAAQRSVSRPARAAQAPALLAGLVRCAGCGHVMSRGITSVPVYSCHRHHSGAECPEPAAVTVALLDRHVEPIAVAELAKIQNLQAAHTGNEIDQAREELARGERELHAYLTTISAADVGPDAFRVAAQERKATVDAARRALQASMAQHSATLPAGIDPTDLWTSLDAHERNHVLRSLLTAVVVRRAGGRGAVRVPLADRVRVLDRDFPLAIPTRRGGAAAGIVPILLPDPGTPGVLGPLRVGDRL